MKDWCFNTVCLERFKQHFPDARSLEISDAGHYVMEDARDEVIQGFSTSWDYRHELPEFDVGPKGDFGLYARSLRTQARECTSRG